MTETAKQLEPEPIRSSDDDLCADMDEDCIEVAANGDAPECYAYDPCGRCPFLTGACE